VARGLSYRKHLAALHVARNDLTAAELREQVEVGETTSTKVHHLLEERMASLATGQGS
jgi:hypothetical protein